MNGDLESHYDAVIIGTGLSESIAAAALAKDGKSVLHLDKNKYYGSEWASFTLEGLMDWAATLSSLQEDCKEPVAQIDCCAEFDPTVLLEIMKQARMDYQEKKYCEEREALEEQKMLQGIDEEKGISEDNIILEEKTEGNPNQFEGWELKCIPLFSYPRAPAIISQTINCAESQPGLNASHPSWESKVMQSTTEVSSDESKVHPSFFGYKERSIDPRPTFEELLHQSRRFNLDLLSKLILGSGISVQTMVKAGVEMYLEFQTINGVYLGPDQETRTADAQYARVPCMKGDMVKSKILSILEKRHLMRFLQFCMEWGRQQSGEDVTTQNERELGQGRSLNRPQNQEQRSSVIDAVPFLEQGRPFVEFLEHCQLSQHAQRLVIYALGLTPHKIRFNKDEPLQQNEKVLSTLEGLRCVSRHLRGIGQFGETAFLTTIFGCSEIPQAFCRLAAVNGAIYMLGNAASSFIVEKNSNKVIGVVMATGELISCDMVVCSPDYLPQVQLSNQKILRRISIFTECSNEESDRLAFIIPPDCPEIGNSSPIHVVALNEGAKVSPRGFIVVHFTTLQSDGDCEQVLERAKQHLAYNWPSFSENGSGEAALGDEVWSLTFSIPCHRPLAESWQNICELKPEETTESENAFKEQCLPSNIAVASREASELCIFQAFEEAKTMFEYLCPGHFFFPEASKNLNKQPGEEDFDGFLLDMALKNALVQSEKTSTSVELMAESNVLEMVQYSNSQHELNVEIVEPSKMI